MKLRRQTAEGEEQKFKCDILKDFYVENIKPDDGKAGPQHSIFKG